VFTRVSVTLEAICSHDDNQPPMPVQDRDKLVDSVDYASSL